VSGAPDSLRLLSYNIHGCIGRDGVENAERVLELIRRVDADVVALQEVYDLDDADRNFLRGLDALGYTSVIYGQTMQKTVGPYGIILMSRRTPSEFERIDLSLPGAEPRGAIRAVIPFAGESVSICATHLGLRAEERQAQLTKLAQSCPQAMGDSGTGPGILMGDLNEWWPLSVNLFTIRKRFHRTSEWPTFPVWFPVFALDRICVQGCQGKIHFHRPSSDLARVASDHRPIVADLCCNK